MPAPTTLRALAGVPGFTPLLLTATAQSAAQTTAGLAVGLGVLHRTGSALLAALAMFGPALARAVGAATVLRWADRVPPRGALAGTALLFAAGTAVQALPGLPGPVLFAVLFGLGTAGSLAGGVRGGLLSELLPAGAYALGRAALSMADGLLQVAGFALGGLLTALLTPGATLLVAAALHLAAAAVARFGLPRRPPRQRAGRTRPALRLLADGPRRTVLLALWLPNGLVVGCESLLLPYSPAHAGLLLACAAAGMLLGDTVTGRFLPARLRSRLAVPLCLLLAAPFPLLALHPPLPLAAAAVALGAIGYAAALPLQERLLALTPPERHGQALGLHNAGMLTAQGACAALAGALADHGSPGTAIALLAAASLATTLALAPGLTDRHRPVGPVACGTTDRNDRGTTWTTPV
ncbi:MFS transporter [Kitasatospora sp. NPDC006697]|uniref:MFS transporter n=1 Tax=Kitasatospora sp. NPDC006697 TaxID=3364020 RepID=UPI0036A11D82